MIAFRFDACLELGIGHFVRCLTLARELPVPKGQILFICAEHQGHLQDWIHREGFKCMLLPLDGVRDGYLSSTTAKDAARTINALIEHAPKVSLLVIDHYDIGDEWEKCLAPYADKMVVFDDLANRKHFCDLVIDQEIGHTPATYMELVPARAKVLGGVSYAFVRREFLSLRNKAIEKRRQGQKLEGVVVFMGGGDIHNATGMVISMLGKVKPSLAINVIIRSSHPFKNSIIEMAAASHHKVTISIDPIDIPELFLEADLGIGAGGGSAWERCCLGLPSILINVASNQDETIEELVRSGVGISLGKLHNLSESSFVDCLEGLIRNPVSLNKMSAAAFSLVDGRGVQRVMSEINQIMATAP